MSERIERALALIGRYGGTDGDHHKAWVIDQAVRALTGCPIVVRSAVDCRGAPYEYADQGESDEYLAWVALACDGEDGPNTYEWSNGTPP